MNATITRSSDDVSRLRRHRLRQADDRPTYVMAFNTSLDWMALAWKDELLQGVVFGHPSRHQAEIALAHSLRLTRQFFCLASEGQPESDHDWTGDLPDRLRRYANGEAVDFNDVPLATSHLTDFGRRVVGACRKLTWGQVSTYGDLAAACGSPGAARAVGTVMAKNRFPLIVPCHRVLGAAGSLGGYSAPDGLRMKRRLLTMEGVYSRGA